MFKVSVGKITFMIISNDNGMINFGTFSVFYISVSMNITPSVPETKMNNCYDNLLDAVKTLINFLVADC